MPVSAGQLTRASSAGSAEVRTNFRLAFFRPLSALTHILDYRLWAKNPVGYHITNILLWLLVLLAAGSLARRLAPTARAATLSFFIFALADARALVIIWVARLAHSASGLSGTC